MSTSTATAAAAGPSFRLTKEQEEIRKLARDFADKEITPTVAEHYDRDGRFLRRSRRRRGSWVS